MRFTPFKLQQKAPVGALSRLLRRSNKQTFINGGV